MGYKDKQKTKEYQREWARRKRKGLPTKIINKPKVTKEQSKQKIRLWIKKDKEKVREMREKVWGNRCKLCQKNKSLVLHNKKNKKHGRNYSYIKKALKKPGEWVRLCEFCHKGVHFCMKFFKMSWEEIEKNSVLVI